MLERQIRNIKLVIDNIAKQIDTLEFLADNEPKDFTIMKDKVLGTLVATLKGVKSLLSVNKGNSDLLDLENTLIIQWDIINKL